MSNTNQPNIKTTATPNHRVMIHMCPRSSNEGWVVLGEDHNGKFKMLFEFCDDAFAFIENFIASHTPK